MRKMYLVLSVILALYSCTQDVNYRDSEMQSIELAGKASSKNVTLVSAWTANRSSPVNTNYQRRFKVKVKNLAFQKEVAIHHETLNGTWVDIPLTFEATIDNGEEIWVGEVTPDTEVYTDQFVVKYTVNGETFWDNNNGENYSMLISMGGYLIPEIPVEVNKSFTRATGTTSYAINVNAIYDYGNATTIEVRYTTDGWVTQEVAALTYQRYFRVGYANYIMSPNQFDVAVYDTTIRVADDVPGIEFAIVYKVKGKEYWDNNYGANYVLNKITY